MEKSARRLTGEEVRVYMASFDLALLTNAVEVCQLAYTKKVVVNNTKKGLTLRGVCDLEHCKMNEMMVTSTVALAVRAMIRRVCVLTQQGIEDFPRALQNKTMNVKSFMMAYMVQFFPDKLDIGEHVDGGEELKKDSTNLLKVYGDICDDIMTCKNMGELVIVSTRAKVFHEMLWRYLKSYNEWKVVYQKMQMFKLTSMIHDYVEKRSSLVGNDTKTQDKIGWYRTEEQSLKEKVTKLLGAHALDALNQQLRSRAKSRRDAAINLAAKAEDGQDNGRPHILGKRPRHLVAPERMSNADTVHQMLMDTEFVSNKQDKPDMVHLHAIDTFSENFWGFVQDDLCMSSPVFFRVKRVLRELHASIRSLHVATGPFVVNYNTTLPFDFIHFYVHGDHFTLRSLMRTMVHIKRVLQSCFTAFVTVPCKEGGIKLHGQEVDLKSLVKEEMEMEIEKPFKTDPTKKNDPVDKNDRMETGFNHDEFEWETANRGMKEFIIGCDDDEGETNAFTRALRFLIEDAKKLRATVSTVRFLLLKPMVEKHGIEYEQSKFKWMAEGDLTTTRAFIRETVCGQVKEGLLTTSDLSTNNSVQATPFKNILEETFISVLVERPHATKDTCPETLLLDMQDLIKMQEEFTRQVTIASIIVCMGSRFGEVRIPNPTVLIDNICEALVRMESTFDTFSSMIEVVREELDKIPHMVYGDKDTLCVVLAASNNKSRPIPKLMSARLRGVLSAALQGDNLDMSNNKDVSTLCEKLKLPRVVLLVVRKTFKLGTKFKSIMDLNIKVHADIYNKIIGEECAAKAPAPAAPSAVHMEDVTAEIIGEECAAKECAVKESI